MILTQRTRRTGKTHVLRGPVGGLGDREAGWVGRAGTIHGSVTGGTAYGLVTGFMDRFRWVVFVGASSVARPGLPATLSAPRHTCFIAVNVAGVRWVGAGASGCAVHPFPGPARSRRRTPHGRYQPSARRSGGTTTNPQGRAIAVTACGVGTVARSCGGTGGRCQCSYRQKKTFSVPERAPTTAETSPHEQDRHYRGSISVPGARSTRSGPFPRTHTPDCPGLNAPPGAAGARSCLPQERAAAHTPQAVATMPHHRGRKAPTVSSAARAPGCGGRAEWVARRPGRATIPDPDEPPPQAPQETPHHSPEPARHCHRPEVPQSAPPRHYPHRETEAASRRSRVRPTPRSRTAPLPLVPTPSTTSRPATPHPPGRWLRRMRRSGTGSTHTGSGRARR